MHAVIETLLVFLQVVFIDLVLAGDNAVMVGIAAAGLHGRRRRKAIAIGIGAATLLRIAFAIFASFLLQLVGLLLAGGILLLWVCWKMWRELRVPVADGLATAGGAGGNIDGAAGAPAEKTLRQAIWQIVAADVSMSIDNVLAVAGAAHEHPIVLAFGLALSVVLMGLAASLIARLLDAHRWIAYAGLVIIVGVAFSMIYRGGVAAATAVGF